MSNERNNTDNDVPDSSEERGSSLITMQDLVDSAMIGGLDGAYVGAVHGFREAAAMRTGSTIAAVSNVSTLKSSGLGFRNIGKAGKALGPVGVAISVGFSASDAYGSFSDGQDLDGMKAIGAGVGGLGGAAAGAAVGAAIGTAFFGVGAVPGAILGAAVGALGAWIGGMVGESAGRAAGVENKYKGVLKYKDIRSNVEENLEESLGREPTEGEINNTMIKLVPMLNDAGFRVEEYVGNWLFGETQTRESYGAISHTPTLEGLQNNLVSMAQRRVILKEQFDTDQIASHRITRYQDTMNRQVEYLERMGKFEGMVGPDGQPMTNEEGADYIRGYIDSINDKYTDVTPPEKVMGAVVALNNLQALEALSDDKVLDFYVSLVAEQRPEMTEEQLRDFKYSVSEAELNDFKRVLYEDGRRRGELIAFENTPEGITRHERNGADPDYVPPSETELAAAETGEPVQSPLEAVRSASETQRERLAAERNRVPTVKTQETGFLESLVGIFTSFMSAIVGMFGGENETRSTDTRTSDTSRTNNRSRTTSDTTELSADERALAADLGSEINRADREGRNMDDDGVVPIRETERVLGG